MSEIDLMLKPNDKLYRADLLSQRPLHNSSSRKGSKSAEGKNRSFIFRKKELPNREYMHHSGEFAL